MDLFSNDLNSSMMFKGQHPEYTLMVSLEANSSEFDSFWKNTSLLKCIPSDTIIVRLYQSENSNDIRLFDFTFHYSNIPSLFIFGPNQAAISHSWNDHFPTVDEFLLYFNNKIESTDGNINDHNSTPNYSNNDPNNDNNNSDTKDMDMQSHSTSDQFTTTINTINNPEHAPLKPPNSAKTLIQRPPPRSQPQQKKASLILSNDQTTNNSNQTIQQKKKNIARISVQGLTKTVKKEFPSNSTIGDLRDWIRSEFGRDLDLIVAHTHKDLPTDPNTTFSEADLCPSAVIRERDGGNATLRNDENLNIGILDRNEQANENNNTNESFNHIYENENAVTNSPSNSSGSSFNNNNNNVNNNRIRRRNNNNTNSDNTFALILKYCRLLFRLLNPWADDEEDNENTEDIDFESSLWQYKPNPGYMNSRLNQMYQDSRQNVQQEDSWHPSRF